MNFDIIPDELFVRGIAFKPFLYLKYVEEPEFGCEGRPEGAEPSLKIRGARPNRPVEFSLPESVVTRNHLEDACFVGYLPLRDGTQITAVYNTIRNSILRCCEADLFEILI